MTIVRIIRERLRLDACAAGMSIDVPYSVGASWKSVGSVILVKIKPLAKAGMVQVKVKARYSKDARVQKFDIPGATMVVHEREATEADGPDAGTPMRAIAHHDGIRYQAVRAGDDAGALVAEAVERQRPRPMDEATDEMLAMPGGAILAYALASASRMAGMELRPMDARMPSSESFAAVTEILAAAGARRVGPGRHRPEGGAAGLKELVDRVEDEMHAEAMQAARMIEDRAAGIWPGE